MTHRNRWATILALRAQAAHSSTTRRLNLPANAPGERLSPVHRPQPILPESSLPKASVCVLVHLVTYYA